MIFFTDASSRNGFCAYAAIGPADFLRSGSFEGGVSRIFMGELLAVIEVLESQAGKECHIVCDNVDVHKWLAGARYRACQMTNLQYTSLTTRLDLALASCKPTLSYPIKKGDGKSRPHREVHRLARYLALQAHQAWLKAPVKPDT